MPCDRTLPPSVRAFIAARYKDDLKSAAGPVNADVIHYGRQRCMRYGHTAAVVLQYKKGTSDDGRYILVVRAIQLHPVFCLCSLVAHAQCSRRHPGDLLGSGKLFAFISPPIPVHVLREIQDRKFARELDARLMPTAYSAAVCFFTLHSFVSTAVLTTRSTHPCIAPSRVIASQDLHRKADLSQRLRIPRHHGVLRLGFRHRTIERSACPELVALVLR